MRPLIFLIFLHVVLLVHPAALSQASPEVRGTWITTTGLTNATSTIRTPADTTLNFQRLRNIGLNTVYIDVFRNGNTYFRSPTLHAITGNFLNPTIGSRDILRETVIQARRNRMAPFAWFQYGLMAKFGNPGSSPNELARYMADRGWLLQDINNAFTNSSQPFSWMNPLVPEVRQLVRNLALEVVANYDVVGIQWDDHLAWPRDFGYDTFTRTVYFRETGRQVPTTQTGTAWADFVRWRADKITEFAQELITAVRAVRPNLIISISPSVHPFGYDNFSVDYPSWVRAGMFDEFVPQVYRSGFANFDRDWDGTTGTGGQVQHMGTRRGDFVAGVSLNMSAANNTPAVIQQQINLVRATSGVAGHSIWFSEGLLNIAGAEASFTSFYNVAGLGHAPRPDIPLSSLPAPVVGTSVGGNTWQFTVPSMGVYELIFGNANVWSSHQHLILSPGVHLLTTPPATHAELLWKQPAWLIPEPASLSLLALPGLLLLRNPRSRSSNLSN